MSRYLLRPAIVVKRLSLTPAGKVRYGFKREWRDGSSAVEMAPMTFISRLAALVPAPRVNLVTYHGLLAPAASYRDRVVPEVVGEPVRRIGRLSIAELEAGYDPVKTLSVTESVTQRVRLALAVADSAVGDRCRAVSASF